MAIDHAMGILDWQSNLPSEDQPPRWMWAFDDELSTWFDEVRRKQKERYGGKDSDSGDGGQWDTNLAAAGRGRNA